MAIISKATSRRPKRTGEQLFLDKLEKLAGSGGELINNGVLREALGWTEDRYNEVKKVLRKKKCIVVGPGPGGMIGLPLVEASVATRALNVFISYSHADEAITNELLKHLEPLRKLDLIRDWHDRKIEAGAPQNKKSASFRAYGTDSITIDGIDQQYWAASGRQSELAGHLCAQSWVDEVVLPIRVSLSGSLRASASRACAAALSLIHSLPGRFLTSNLKPPVVPSFAKVGTGLGNAEAGQEYFSKGLRREGRRQRNYSLQQFNAASTVLL